MSKQYRLGLTRTSLPDLVSGWLKHALRGRSPSTGDNRFWALKDVSFSIEAGESLALIGSNGAGKTTILKLLANITKPTTGSVEVDGKLSALIELGAGFHPDLTGRENVFLNGNILGLSRREVAARFDEILDFSEIEPFIDTPVKRYSSGMVVRLGFAVAACIEPEILLVDEVLAVGDASFQEKCMQRIRSLLRNGTSIVFVSHNLYLVQAVCSRALYLEHGRLRATGPTRDIIDLYEHDLHARRAERLDRPAARGEVESASIEITRVEVVDAPDATQALRNDRPAEIRIHYHAYQSPGRAQVSVFVKRSDGLTCCMMRTKLDGMDLRLDRGAGVVSLFLEPLQLITGSYYAEAWFLNESDSMAIVQQPGRSDWFMVKGTALSYAEDSGVFEPRTRWSHQPEALPSEVDGRP